MNVKKLISSVSALAIAASAFAGLAVSANAEEANVSAAAFAGFNTAATEDVYTNTPIKMNQIDLNGNGGFKTISTFAFAKFDVSAYSEYTIGTATLSYDVTADAYNSGMALGTVTDISNDWTADAITVDTAKAYTGAWLFNKNSTGLVWSDKNKTKSISYDVTDAIKNAIKDNDGIVTFFVATTTGREQTLDSIPSLTVTYSEKAAAGAVNVSYVAGDNTIGAPAAQPSVEGLFTGDTVTFAFPAYVKSGDKYYKSAETGFNKKVTLTDAAQDVTVSYVEADKVVDYAEVDVANYGGHKYFAEAAANLNASDGKDGGTVYASGNCYQTFNVPVNGNYNITVNAVGTASKDRSVYLNVDGTDEATRIGTLSCSNGSTAVQTVNVDLTAGEHTFYFVGNGGISPILDYMVVELVSEAVVEPTKYTITLDYGDGTDPVPTEVEENGTFTFPTPEDQEGFTFGGWKLNKLGGDDVIVQGGEGITVTGDATYTAVWNEVVAPVVDPTVNVEKIGVFTEDAGNPAAAFKGEVTAGTYAIEGLYWGVYNGKQYVYPANKDDYKVDVTVAADSNIVLGIVVEAATVDVNNINADLFVAG